MADFILKEPLIFTDGTGFDVNPNTQIFAKTSGIDVVFSIAQEVSTSSNVEFADLTLTDKLILDNDTFILRKNEITGSFTHTGNLITSVDNTFVHNGDMTIGNILTAEKIVSEISQSATFFESGSTLFGDSLDDSHQRTGSLSISGSSISINYGSVTEISHDTTLADSNATTLVTENAVKTYLNTGVGVFQTYQRKSFAHTGSFVSVSTASFAAVTASAPSGVTATSEDDFMFFVNGAIAEYDALNIQQSGSYLYLKVNNDSIGYDLKDSDEIVAWGKFDNPYYLDFDGLTNEVTTNFSGSNAVSLNKTYSWWMNSTHTARNYSVFGYGGNKRAFTPNFSSGRPLMWNGGNWYVYWEDTSAQDDGEWHHWMLHNDVAAITGSKLYVDGTLIEVNAYVTSGTAGVLSQALTIGSYQNNSTNTGRHFEGSIREFAVFSGDKTSKAGVYYNSGSVYDLTGESDLQGYWKMNEGSGITVTDLSGEGNDGTIDGATWDYIP
jgi:hypothetical protein|tara:strand:+ start:1360 stop:2847 length:1488 start_codon:yes stop_codon:yes gene_type:complete